MKAVKDCPPDPCRAGPAVVMAQLLPDVLRRTKVMLEGEELALAEVLDVVFILSATLEVSGAGVGISFDVN